MNFLVLVKFLFKKILGSYFGRYRSEKDKLDQLEKILPACLRENFGSEVVKKKGRVLMLTSGLYDGYIDAIYAKALEALGFEVHFLTNYTPFLERLFSFFGIKNIHYYDSYLLKITPLDFKEEANEIINNNSEVDILRWLKNGIQVGAFAASTFLRATRLSSFALNQENRGIFQKLLISSLMAEKMAVDVLDKIKPEIVFMIDRGYTPTGQIFDLCLQRGIDVITRNSSHKSGYEILKRYKTPEMAVLHPYGLSDKTWNKAKNMVWDDQKWQKLYNEIAVTYKSGDWFSEVGTQFNKNLYNKDKIFDLLGLDRNKKTAVVFSHIFWDGTFFWGRNLFKDYYEWFKAVLKVVALNDKINWVIKIHPANLAKAKRDNYKGESLEERAIRDVLGEVPDHIKVIPANSDINTFSLFSIIDFCLTVRGTPGLESAMFGVKTLTAGTGRYDGLGFTFDFKTPQSYLDFLEQLPQAPEMTQQQIELARRFAFASLIWRPIHLDILDCGFIQDEKSSIKFKPLFKTKEEFKNSKFVKSFQEFILLGQEDYLTQ